MSQAEMKLYPTGTKLCRYVAHSGRALAFFVLSMLSTTVWISACLGAQPSVPPANLPQVISAAQAIKRWDSAGKLAGSIGEHDGPVYALTFVPGSGGSELATGGADGLVKIWNVAAGRMLLRLDTRHVEIRAIAISPDGHLIATGGTDGANRLWERGKTKPLTEMNANSDPIRALQFTRDGHSLLSAGADRAVRRWKVEEGGRVLNYVSDVLAHDDTVTSLCLSPDEKSFASVSLDGFLKVWELNSNALKLRIRVSLRGVLTVAYAPDGHTIATGDEEGRIRVWNSETGMSMPINGSRDGAINVLAWTPDGKLLVAGSTDKTLSYWDVGTGRQIACIAAHDGPVRALAIVP